ncbi:MAG TPA: glycosyltransferase WbuB, partial [Gemmatimonadetes bacterium]|nr:glycosyltransferase WbuB [Gemmatimonadota bacterium]
VWVPPEDPSALADGIRELHANRARLRQLGRDGRAWVTQHRGRQQMADRFVEYIMNIDGEPAVSPPVPVREA